MDSELKKNPYFKQYFEGKIQRESLLELIKNNPALANKGGVSHAVAHEFINQLQDDDSWDTRRGSAKYLNRWLDKTGLASASMEERVHAIRSLPVERILEIINGINSAVKGVKRKKFSMKKWFVGNTNDGFSIEPIQNPLKELKLLIAQMKENLTIHNNHLWAAKLYIAIIYAHIFANGNGRTSRFCYCYIRGLQIDEKMLKIIRTARVPNGMIDYYTVRQAYVEEGIIPRSYTNRILGLASGTDFFNPYGARPKWAFLAVCRFCKEHDKTVPQIGEEVDLSEWNQTALQELKKIYLEITDKQIRYASRAISEFPGLAKKVEEAFN